MFSIVFHGTRTSGTVPLSAITAKQAAAVSKLDGECSSSTVSQSKPELVISRAATTSGSASQVPTLDSPAASL